MIVVGIYNACSANASQKLGKDIGGNFLPGEVANRRKGEGDLLEVQYPQSDMLEANTCRWVEVTAGNPPTNPNTHGETCQASEIRSSKHEAVSYQ